ILADNNVLPEQGLLPEHGFSVLIERGSHRLLFDTGDGPALVHNSQRLGIDLSGLDAVILSHGHYDHTGGLLHVAKLNPGIRVVAHPKAFGPHYKDLGTGTDPRYIGIPHSARLLNECGATFQLTTEPQTIIEGVWYTGFVPLVFGGYSDSRLVIKTDDGLIPDQMEDDASLLVNTSKGPVLLLGCAHAGIPNILEHLKEQQQIEAIHMVIGGTHLSLWEKSQTNATIDALERFMVEYVAPAHCTGKAISADLKNHFQDRFKDVAAGDVFSF
ncbi:MBL fold metallo-hydrolase, partial [Thermodesulfobacteriota bacterium]